LRKRTWPDVDDSKRKEVMDDYKATRSSFIKKWNESSIPTLHAFTANSPFDELSFYRSIQEFFADLYRIPEKVLEALDIITTGLAEAIKSNALSSGAKGLFFGCYRLGCEFISPKQFEKFGLPFLSKLVNILTDAGILVTLHCDNDWSLNLPYLRELPRGKCIIALDNHTDIFKAKKILRDHMCILGDVPAGLLSIGTPKEVEDYCKKLIDTVGEGGGFILGSGDELPVDTKPENLTAMLETAKTYGLYR
jgi:uroporphyrinogen-III decarboxylase